MEKYRTASEEEVIEIIKNVAQTALTESKGYFSINQVTLELSIQGIGVPKPQVENPIGKLYHIDPIPPKDLVQKMHARRLYSATDPVTHEEVTFGMPDLGFPRESRIIVHATYRRGEQNKGGNSPKAPL